MTLNDIQNAINGIVQKFQPQENKPPISPLAGQTALTTPGMQYYSQMQDAINSQAKSNPALTPTPTQDQPNPVEQAISQLVNTKSNQQVQADADAPKQPLSSPSVIGAPKGASDYESQAAKIFQQQGIPPEVGLGIYAMEGRGKTINPNNPYNIGAYDSNPQNAKAYGFKDPIEGTKAAAKFLAGDSPYQTTTVKKVFQQALDAYKKSGNPVDYLRGISGVYSTNANYWQTIVQTPEYQRWAFTQ